jgi:hypothetical protein
LIRGCDWTHKLAAAVGLWGHASRGIYFNRNRFEQPI